MCQFNTLNTFVMYTVNSRTYEDFTLRYICRILKAILLCHTFVNNIIIGENIECANSISTDWSAILAYCFTVLFRVHPNWVIFTFSKIFGSHTRLFFNIFYVSNKKKKNIFCSLLLYDIVYILVMIEIIGFWIVCPR